MPVRKPVEQIEEAEACLLTVGVPVYNGDNYLERCLSNLTAETLNFRILISDNHSTDQTQKICEQFAALDQRIKYVRHPKNLGVEANYEYVINACETKYISLRAHDDYSNDNYFSKLVNMLEKSGCELASGRRTLVDVNGSKIPNQISDKLERKENFTDHSISSSRYYYYGVYRTDVLTEYWKLVFTTYPNPWGHEFLIVLPFIINKSIITSDSCEFYQTVSQLSDERYRPKTVIGSMILIYQFWKCGWKITSRCNISFSEKIITYPLIIVYANGRAEKYRRVLKRIVFFPYYYLKKKRSNSTP